MPAFFRDLSLSARSLLRQPLFTGMAVASLALGIGAGTVIFSVVYALLLRPLPYPHPEGIVHVGLLNPAEPSEDLDALTPETLKTLRQDPRSGLTALGGFGYDYANLTGVPTPAQLVVLLVTVDYFRVYGVPAARGRWFGEADCRADSAPGVVISDHLWRTQFGGDEGIVGRTIILDDKPHVVLGVMPADFKDIHAESEVWLPLAEDGPLMAADSRRRYVATARLADPSARGRAQLDVLLSTVSGRLAQTDPVKYKNLRLAARPLEGATLVGPAARRALWLLLGAVGCVLLVTCANVANLQLVRAAARRREIGVRLALGASRGRIIASMLADSVVLAGLGAGLGILLAAWGVDAVAALLPAGYSPLQDGIHLDGPVLGFAVAAATVAALLTGGLPAWFAARQDPAGSLGSGAGRGASEGPGGARARAGLVVGEIALALVLLAGAGLMGRSLLAALRTHPGVRLDGTLVLNLSPSPARYPDRPARAEFYRRLLASVDTVPGVAGTALGDTALFSWYDDFRFLLPGQNADAPETQRQRANDDAINPGGFAALGISLRRGRDFDARDTAGAPLVAVVNEEFARHFLPGGDALGRRFTALDRQPAEYEVVGVVGDVRRTGLSDDAPPAAYFSYLQRPSAYVALYVHAAPGLDPESLTRAVESAIWRVDPDQAIGTVTTLARAARGSVAYTRLYAVLFAAFAGLTLVLAALGIYGTVSYSVAQRTRELGIRLALGAGRASVLRLVLGQGARLVGAGLVVGLVAALALARLLASLLFGVAANDPATLAGVALVLGGVAMLASYLPARRATRIDPLQALRED